MHSDKVSQTPNFISAWLRDIPVIDRKLEFSGPSDLLMQVAPLKETICNLEAELQNLGVDCSQSLMVGLDKFTPSQART